MPPPAACATACETTPGAPTTCPTGFHCSVGGKCDTLCTSAGNQCGDGYACTTDGFCVSKGGNGSNGNGNGNGNDGPDANCPNVQFTATKVIPSIQLLIDRSGSMLNNFADKPPQPGDDVKFDKVKEAIIGPNGVVTQLASQIYFGLSMYPDNACPKILQLGRSLNNGTSIANFLQAHAPFSSDSQGLRDTPTPTSIDAAVADFIANPPPPGSPPVIVLATDGLPNSCTDNRHTTESESVTAAENAFLKGFPVFVLSVGDTNGTAAHFQALANAGQGVKAGQPNASFFPAGTPEQLAAAFQTIIRGVVSCDLTLNGTVDADSVSSGVVTLNGTNLTYPSDWTLDANGMTIHLLGNACKALKDAANPTVKAEFPCGGGVILF